MLKSDENGRLMMKQKLDQWKSLKQSGELDVLSAASNEDIEDVVDLLGVITHMTTLCIIGHL